MPTTYARRSEPEDDNGANELPVPGKWDSSSSFEKAKTKRRVMSVASDRPSRSTIPQTERNFPSNPDQAKLASSESLVDMDAQLSIARRQELVEKRTQNCTVKTTKVARRDEALQYAPALPCPSVAKEQSKADSQGGRVLEYAPATSCPPPGIERKRSAAHRRDCGPPPLCDSVESEQAFDRDTPLSNVVDTSAEVLPGAVAVPGISSSLSRRVVGDDFDVQEFDNLGTASEQSVETFLQAGGTVQAERVMSPGELDAHIQAHHIDALIHHTPAAEEVETRPSTDMGIKKKKWRRIAVVAGILLVVGTGIGVGIGIAASQENDPKSPSPATTQQPLDQTAQF